jgi:large subunit ribosomal protein L9
MQIILREDVENLGRSGEVVAVRDGYARNYLVPRGLAVVATPKQVNRLQHEQRQILARVSRLKKDAESMAQKLEALSVTIAAAVGEEQKLYGSVTSRDVEAALADQGYSVDRRRIGAPPIKTLGTFSIPIWMIYFSLSQLI